MEPLVHYHVHENPPLGSVPIQMNTYTIFEIHFNIILTLLPKGPKFLPILSQLIFYINF
jgi:hypothetical protein